MTIHGRGRGVLLPPLSISRPVVRDELVLTGMSDEEVRILNKMRSMLGMDAAWFNTGYDAAVKLVKATSLDDTEMGHHAFLAGSGPAAQILSVAHLDSVAKMKAPRLGKRYYHAPTVDNRIGFWLITRFLPSEGIKMDVLLTDHEESAASTSSRFVTKKSYNWMVQFDRLGADVALYQYYNSKTAGMVAEVGMRPCEGSYTCICNLEGLGVSGFNWGVAYEDYHSFDARVDLITLAKNIVAFKKFFAMHVDEKMPHDSDYRDRMSWGWGGSLRRYEPVAPEKKKREILRPLTTKWKMVPAVCELCKRDKANTEYIVAGDDAHSYMYACHDCAMDILDHVRPQQVVYRIEDFGFIVCVSCGKQAATVVRKSAVTGRWIYMCDACSAMHNSDGWLSDVWKPTWHGYGDREFTRCMECSCLIKGTEADDGVRMCKECEDELFEDELLDHDDDYSGWSETETCEWCGDVVPSEDIRITYYGGDEVKTCARCAIGDWRYAT